MEVTILLVDADSKKGFPNLALMKLSAWHKEQGHEVDLIIGLPEAPPLALYDQTYISCVFFQNREKALDYAMMMPNSIIGGSGWDLENTLKEEIEHILPDYSLYDVDYSMGYTSRGCVRNCGFCIVPKKEGGIHDHAPITEFHSADHDKIMLLDNNFQASPKWKENLDYIREHDLKVNFNQGLDIRTLNTEFVKELSSIKYSNWTFKRKTINFAFDDLRYEKQFREGVKLLDRHGIKPRHLSVYMLVGYNTTREQDIKRFRIMETLGVYPYVMRFNRTKDTWLRHFARYVNRKYFEFIEWDKYEGGVLNEGLL